MNLTRQVDLRFIERAAARTRLRIMDALTKINVHGFAFAHHDTAGRPPQPPARDRTAGAVAPDERLRPA